MVKILRSNTMFKTILTNKIRMKTRCLAQWFHFLLRITYIYYIYLFLFLHKTGN